MGLLKFLARLLPNDRLKLVNVSTGVSRMRCKQDFENNPKMPSEEALERLDATS